MSSSAETRLPTQTFLLPGQQFCIGLPWEREGLPLHGLPAALPKPPLPGAPLTLDATHLDADPCSGIEIGNCTVIRRLSPGDAKTLLAVREENGISTLVVMRRLDLPEHLLREIRAHAGDAKKWQHPNLARVFDVESGDEGIFWISELASGATLAELAVAAKKAGRGMPLGLALAAVYESALALNELHSRDQAHGLICDASVALSFDGTTRLLDAGLFGCIARNASWGEVLQPMGPYFAPEQVLRGYPPDPKCDVYSLGVVLYECLSGEKVRRGGFEAQVKQATEAHWVPPSSFSVSLAPQLTQVVLKALSPDRAQRFPNALAFAKALREAAGDFVWRTTQRSAFVSELFELRKRREQVLLAALAEYKKNPTRPSLPLIEAASVEIPIIEGLELEELPPLAPVQPLASKRPSAKKLSKVKRRGSSLPAVTAFVASFSALFAVGSPVGLELLEPHAPMLTAVIRALPPTAAQLAKVPYLSSLYPAPAPVVAAEPVVADEGPWMSEEVAPAAEATAPDAAEITERLLGGAVQAVGTKPRAVHKVKHKDDVPEAPWLRRGRR